MRMKLCLFLCLAALPTRSGAAQTRTFKLVPGSQIQFVSDAPLERITGLTSKATGEISVDPSAPRGAKAQVAVPVASIRTNNDLRDEHLRSDSWLDAARYPNIELVVTSVSGLETLLPDTAQEATVTGRLTIHGVTQDVNTKARVRFTPANAESQAKAEGDALRVQASFVVKLNNHNVSIPSIVALKVSPNVQVNVDLRARSSLPSAPVAAPAVATGPTAPSVATPIPPAESTAKAVLPAAKKLPKSSVPPAAPKSPQPASTARSEKPLADAPQGPAAHVRKLRNLMREARKALAANDPEQAEKLVKRAQHLLGHLEEELSAQP